MRSSWSRSRDQLLRKEKDEASLCRVCEPGFPECLHSPNLRGLRVFYFVVSVPNARRHPTVVSHVARRYPLKPRSGLSTKNRLLTCRSQRERYPVR